MKVRVAMSGGIDSGVSAALLKKQGFEVEGVFMRLFNSKESKESEKRARMIARKLRIPFYVLNLKKEFRKKIFDYFLKEIKEGRTPNPCVVCNKEIKFGILLKGVPGLLATGHYARIEKTKKGRALLKAKDKEKDQSYFLWKLGQKELKRVVFPLSGFTKKQVKSLASKWKLPVKKDSESQEICFVSGKLNDFLKNHLKVKPGEIQDEKGKVLGEHSGLHFYTIGQRKGIGLSGGPYYVIEKDLKSNVLRVSRNEKHLFRKELLVKNLNWISGLKPRLPFKCSVSIRYGQEPVPAVLKPAGSRIRVVFKKPLRAIAFGQSAVFYKGRELSGGGIIC